MADPAHILIAEARFYDDIADELVQAMQQNPAMGQVRLEYETTLPQLFF